MKNTLKCNITGTERVTNVPYLAKKADRLGIDIDTYKQFYVSKSALTTLKSDLQEVGIAAVMEDYGETEEVITAYINYNGKNKYVPVVVPVDETSEEEVEEFASTELATV